MKVNSKKILHLIITLIIGTIVPLFILLNVYSIVKDNFFDLDFINIGKVVFLVVTTTVSYYGILNILKPFLESFTSWTQNESILKSITVIFMALSVFSLIKTWDYYNIALNYNDKGLLLEIIGFFIYLNPISQRLTKFVSSRDDKIDTKLMIQSTAIILVLTGLILQFSYFN